MGGLFRWFLPYLMAAIVGAVAAGSILKVVYARDMAEAQMAHARDNQQHAEAMKAISETALTVERQRTAERDAAAIRIDALNVQLTQESNQHAIENDRFRAALSSGTERVRVAVTRCSTSGNAVPGASRPAGVDDGDTAVADLAPEIAQRVFGVAGDDQHEIDKLRALQGYVCSIMPNASVCRK